MDEGVGDVLIDCDSCQVRDVACSECVVTVLLRTPAPAAPVELDETERAAIGVLADSGLVPPLRLVSGSRTSGPATGTYDEGHEGGSARAG